MFAIRDLICGTTVFATQRLNSREKAYKMRHAVGLIIIIIEGTRRGNRRTRRHS